MNYPKIGIRPAIDGRWGGIREGLEAQTMGMAEAAARLISASLRYPDGTPVQCVISETTIGGGAEAASDVQWITNFIIQPGYYGSDGEKKGYDRYLRIGEELARTGGMVEDEQAAMDILSIVGRRSWNNDDDNGCTVHSAVYNLTDKSVLWVPNEHYGEDGALFRFALEP